MTSTKLTPIDKIQIKADIGLSFVIGLLFCTVTIFLVFLVPFGAYLFGSGVKEGFVNRSLFVIGLLFIPFLAISWTNILKYVDLVRDKKIKFEVTTFDVEIKKDSILILTSNNYKFKIFDNILPSLITDKPLTIEFLPLSKKVLFISHDDQNYLE